jgi:hypothetical protein
MPFALTTRIRESAPPLTIHPEDPTDHSRAFLSAEHEALVVSDAAAANTHSSAE